MLYKMWRLNLKEQKGFTLMELLIVILIIGVLMAIAVPVYNNITNSAMKSAHQANIRVIEGAITAYLADNGGGSYSAVVMDNKGNISGTNITPGELVSGYLKAMPENPLASDSPKYYVKAANDEVKGEE